MAGDDGLHLLDPTYVRAVVAGQSAWLLRELATLCGVEGFVTTRDSAKVSPAGVCEACRVVAAAEDLLKEAPRG